MKSILDGIEATLSEAGRLQPPGAAPGHLLPRHHGIHPAH
jgi:hypothetical protein